MASDALRFGPFKLDTGTGDLEKNGRRVPLSPQPARLLCLLATHAGALITRADIRRHLWGDEVFVDYELGLNACLAHLREILGDSARTPRYIETLPRRGYRFIAHVDRRPRFEPPTVAVLPFANLGGDPSLEFFADGITDALITELASISGLRVISRQTVLHLKGTSKTLAAIADELGTDALVEGTAMHGGTAIRITAQLVAVSPERHIWARAFECTPADIISVQREVARAVAEGVDAALSPLELARLSRPAPVNPNAHEAYLKGLHYGSQWSGKELARALRCFNEATSIDPTYAPAYAAIGRCLTHLAYWGHMRPADAYPLAKEALSKAITLDETLASAHAAKGWLDWTCDWNLAACEREIDRALELGPSHIDVHTLLAQFLLTARGDRDAGIAEGRLALRLDPLSQPANFLLAWTYLFAGDCERAAEQAKKTLELFHDSLQALYVLGLSGLSLGRDREAVAAMEKAAAMSHDSWTIGYLGHVYGRVGRTADAERLLAGLVAERERSFVSLKPFILINIGLGDLDRAFAYLEEAYEARDPILFHIAVAPPAQPLQNDPRYESLIRRLPVQLPADHPLSRNARARGHPERLTAARSRSAVRPSFP